MFDTEPPSVIGGAALRYSVESKAEAQEARCVWRNGAEWQIREPERLAPQLLHLPGHAERARDPPVRTQLLPRLRGLVLGRTRTRGRTRSRGETRGRTGTQDAHGHEGGPGAQDAHGHEGGPGAQDADRHGAEDRPGAEDGPGDDGTHRTEEGHVAGAVAAPSCPQCRQTFNPRPALVKNNILALLVEELHVAEVKNEPQSEGPKVLSAVFGLVLRGTSTAHVKAAPLKKHKLVEPVRSLQDNLCTAHNEIRKLFCCKDKQCICHICCYDSHRLHQVVYCAVERTERQAEIAPNRQNIQSNVDRKRQESMLGVSIACDLKPSANAGTGTEIHPKRYSSNPPARQCRVQQHCEPFRKTTAGIRQQNTGDGEKQSRQVKALRKKILEEIAELERRDEQLDRLSKAEDHNLFLESYFALPKLAEYKESFQVLERSPSYFQDVDLAMSSWKLQSKVVL
ncbi:hypothetical protein WMY93_007954 [Mugilogobius chulae]|uniref:TRIM8/14/16/25/29/45/65 coiled-coil region domain-containing protein n=1 Tax=Mugilogobius chulae TaxID=88201 RepID=A0AAW0PL23_9GOBI